MDGLGSPEGVTRNKACTGVVVWWWGRLSRIKGIAEQRTEGQGGGCYNLEIAANQGEVELAEPNFWGPWEGGNRMVRIR